MTKYSPSNISNNVDNILSFKMQRICLELFGVEKDKKNINYRLTDSNISNDADNISSLKIRTIRREHSDAEKYKKNISYRSIDSNSKINFYKSSESENKEPRNGWLNYVSSINVDFSENSLGYKSDLEEINKILYKKNWNGSIKKFDDAINAYINASKSNRNLKIISSASAKNFLYLIPTISTYSHHIAIDADTGYFNLTFRSKDNGIMTVLITERGELHYSLAEIGMKIVKISGTAKIKDPHDFSKFNKILSML